MKTPERLTALRVAKQTLRIRDQKLARIKYRLESITCVEISQETYTEIEPVIAEWRSEMELLPTTDFKRIFWDQQVIGISEWLNQYRM